MPVNPGRTGTRTVFLFLALPPGVNRLGPDGGRRMFLVIGFLKRMALVVAELLRAPIDALRGVNRRAYAVTLDVEAPKAVTWSVLSAHKITLEGTPQITIDAAPVPGRPGVYKGAVSFSGRTLPIAYQVLEERPEQAMLMTVLKEESAPECCPGQNYICASAVTGDDKASVITMSYEITHETFGSRLLIPFAAVQNASRIKRNAELRAGFDSQSPAAQVKNATITGVLTFASFFALFGSLWDAAMLIGLILIHELGHVIAMRWVGLPVKGIYFVPFFGGVAVSAERYRDEGERGLVALMGPGFSLLTTAVFLWIWQQDGSAVWRDLALMSAFLNGFNLLPVMPLDGGHIAQSLLSRTRPEFIFAFNALTLLAGAALAVSIGAYDLLIILFLISPLIFSSKMRAQLSLLPATTSELVWLAVGYAGSILFYAAAIAALAPSTSG